MVPPDYTALRSYAMTFVVPSHRDTTPPDLYNLALKLTPVPGEDAGPEDDLEVVRLSHSPRVVDAPGYALGRGRRLVAEDGLYHPVHIGSTWLFGPSLGKHRAKLVAIRPNTSAPSSGVSPQSLPSIELVIGLTPPCIKWTYFAPMGLTICRIQWEVA